MKLNIITDLEDKALTSMIEGVAQNNESYSWDVAIEINGRQRQFALAVTDKADVARDMVLDGNLYTNAVYIGDAADVEDVIMGIRAVWPLNENLDIRRARLERVISDIKFKYKAFLYESLLDTMIDSVPDLIWFKDTKGAHMLVNQYFSDIVHKTKEDIRGRGHYYVWDITPEEYSSGEFVCMESEEETMKSGKTCVFDEPLKTNEGMKQLKTYKTPLYDPFGNIFGTVGVAHDVTDFGNMGLELSILIDNIPFPLIMCSNDWTVIRMNAASKRMTPVTEGINFTEWKEHAIYPIGQAEERAKTGTRHQEFRAGDGPEARYIDITEQEITDYFGNASGYFVILRDCTIQKNYERMMIEAANTDVLTGLYNRRYFYDFINNNSGKKLTLLYMDLDHFKDINDSMGHQKGDEVLKATAKAIKYSFPGNVVARLGGDEFAVIIEGEMNENELAGQCKILEENISKILTESPSHKLTISVGIARTEDLEDVDAFIHEGDTRMYEVKKLHHMKLGN